MSGSRGRPGSPSAGRARAASEHQGRVAAGFLAFNSVGFMLFTLIPVVFSIYLAFFDWPLGAGRPAFIGLHNFSSALGSFGFWQVVLNVIYFVGVYVPLNLVVSLGLALVLGPRSKIVKGKNLLRALFFIPVVVPVVASSLIWTALYASNGVFNEALGVLGLGPVGWLTSSAWALPAIIIMSVWLGFGYNMILYIAGMTNIPESLYDAAAIDGAGPWKRFTSVTLPMISPVLFFGTLLTLITSFQVFTRAFILTDGGPGEASTTLVLEIYDQAFRYFRLGYASAISVLLVVLMLIVTGAFFVLQRRWVYYEV